MAKLLNRFMRDDRGTETVEYAVMTAVIVVALVATIVAISGAIQGQFIQITGIGGVN